MQDAQDFDATALNAIEYQIGTNDELPDVGRQVGAGGAHMRIPREALAARLDPVEHPVRGARVVPRDVEPNPDQILFGKCAATQFQRAYRDRLARSNRDRASALIPSMLSNRPGPLSIPS